jgi:hypothetical protein
LAQGALSTDLAFRVRNSANTADWIKIDGTGAMTLSNAGGTGAILVFDKINNGSGYFYGDASSNLTYSAKLAVNGTLYLGNGIGMQGYGKDISMNSGTISTITKITMQESSSIVMRPDFNLALTENNLGLFIAPTSTLNPTKKLIKLMDSTLTTTYFTVNGSGQTGIGTDTPTARLHITAQGALSTDIAFKVRNSANTLDILSVNGNGGTTVLGLSIAQPAGQYYPTLSFSNNGGVGQGSIFGYNSRLCFSSSRITPGNVLSVNFAYFDGNYAQLEVLAKDALSTSNSFGILNNAYSAYLFKVQNNGAIGIGTTTALLASAKVQIDSTTQGFLPPRMTNAERTAIASPAVGLMVYCTDTVEGLYIYKSTGWTFVI